MIGPKGYIITYAGDFVHFVYPSYMAAGEALVAMGHAFWRGNYILFQEGFNIEEVTVH